LNPTIPACPDDPGAPLRRRRRAANRCEPLECGRRDPELDQFEPDRRESSTFSLSESELWAEIRRCRANGWADWELRRRFVNPLDLRRQLEGAAEADRICHPHLENTYV
jgi:hypothetical protein